MSTSTTNSSIRTASRSRLASLIAASAAAALLLAGCATGAADDHDAQEAHDDRTQAETTLVEDAWVKAVDDGMTAAFAILTNDGHHDAEIIAATSPASPMLELHEVVVGEDGASTMRPVDGGLVVPAEGELTLEPGGLHIMFMGVTEPLEPGAEVDITLEFSDGSTQTITAVVKEFTGAEEEYAPGSMDGMGDGDSSEG
jgi:hypothetical protein